MPPADKTIYNTDWILSHTSNIHIATSRDWFDTYTPLTSNVHSGADSKISYPAVGIGSVSIPVKPYVNKPGSNTITLSDVLHVPDALANIVCMSLLKSDYDVERGNPEWKESWVRNKQAAGGRKLGIIEAPVLPKLRLTGQSAGYTSLKDFSPKNTFKGLLWPPKEVNSWEKESGTQARVGVVEAEPAYSQTLSKKEDSSTGLDYEVPAHLRDKIAIPLGQRIGLTYKERRWVEGAYGGITELMVQFGIRDPKQVKGLVREIMLQCNDDDEVTEGRIKARAIMRMAKENPRKAKDLEQYMGLASMMLQAAPDNRW